MMADKFFNSNGIEVGYITKRKQQMREEFGKGLNIGLGSTKSHYEIKPKKKHNTAKDKKTTPPSNTTQDAYTKKEIHDGRTMYFKNNLIISKDEYDKNVKDAK